MSDTILQSSRGVVSTALLDTVVTSTQMWVEVSQATERTFEVTLIRRDHRFYDDDPDPDLIETTVCERTITASLPAMFAAVDGWLINEHRLRVLPHSWRALSCQTGTDLLLEAHALPAQPIATTPR